MKKSLSELKEEAIKAGMPRKDAEGIKDSIEKADETAERIKEEENKIKDNEAKIILGKTFEDIKYVLKKYIKLKEEYYDLVAVWIIGTYCMKSFETYPYLFINAQKGSGKTRLLKLIEALTKKGELLISMREAVLFQIATDERTILIDELENLDRKENYALKELLNACYKRGTKVYRMRKKGKDGDYVPVPYFPFTSIVIANISGTDDVLGDRCITVHLDKSSNKEYSSRQEDFRDSPIIKNIKSDFKQILVYICSLCMSEYTIKTWNMYLDIVYNNNTLNTLTTHTTSNTRENTLKDSVCSVYNRIHESGLTGRPLELTFPLLIVALMLNEEVFENILKFSQELMKKKKDDDVIESKDVSLIEFISKMNSEMDYDKFRFVHELTERFRFFLGIRKEREQEDINPLWLGRALKRLGLVIDKRRLSAGVEVKLNIPKATKLLENFK